MGYKKIGYVIQTPSEYLLTAALKIEQAFGDNFDKEIALAIKSLGRENIRLSNLWWERILVLDHPKLNADADLMQCFMLLLSHFMHQIGVFDIEPVIVDYIVDPVMNIDEVVSRMLGERIPKFTLSELGGEFATIDALTHFFPEVIRRYAIIERERGVMTRRLRQWIGNIGYKVITGQALSAHERSAFVLYGSTKEGSPGHSVHEATAAIPAEEINDLLVNEAGALYQAKSLSGPYTMHQKIISDANLQRLTAYFGPHATDVPYSVGFYQKYGPFVKLALTKAESLTWSVDEHLAGLTARTSYLLGSAEQRNPFSIKVPNLSGNYNDDGLIGAFPDSPDIHYNLTNQRDISDFEFDWFSHWRGARINSALHGGTMELHIVDEALKSRTQGGCQIELMSLDTIGLASYTERAAKRIRFNEGNDITEKHLLPGRTELTDIPFASFYARLGKVEALGALGEYMEVPLKKFMEPAPRAVEYVATQTGMTADERILYSDVITLFHNCARYERLTGNKPPIDAMKVAQVLLKP